MYARVDFPEPLGPIIACVSPELTVRFTPFKICFRPSFVSTDAYKSLISKVDMFLSPILRLLAILPHSRNLPSLLDLPS